MSEGSVVHAEDRFRSREEGGCPELPAVLKAVEVAAFLRVDRKTVYEAAARGEIAGVIRIGRALRFSRDVLLKSLGQGRLALTQSKGAGEHVRTKKNVA
ncbi:MAG: helix-turn-helix domain-containing protein [Myxococcales bacterium]|nr:helix-turn-helix domain-containing protein [Myxococcales bacterium]